MMRIVFLSSGLASALVVRPSFVQTNATAAASEYEKTAGQNCKAKNMEDIMDLEECRKARDALGFPEHSSVIKDSGTVEEPGGMSDRPHGCTVQDDGLIRVYPKGILSCTSKGLNYCICKKPSTCPTDLATKTAEYEAEKAKLATKTTEYETEKAKLATKTTEYETEKANLATKTAELATKTAELATEKAKVATLEAELSTTKASLTAAQAKVNTVKATVG